MFKKQKTYILEIDCLFRDKFYETLQDFFSDTPSRAKLEKGFPVLTPFSTKLGKTSNTSDKLMQSISLGPHSDWGK